MPGKRYDYKKFTKEIEKFRDRLEKGEHITITEEESTDFFGKSIERANTGKCILEKGDDPEKIKGTGPTIPCQLGQKDYSSRITIKNGRRVLEVWKPTSKKKLDRKYHLLGASHFFENHANEIENMIENNDYWYSSWNYSIAAEKKKYLSAPFQLYVGYESKVKAYFRVVDFWTDIEEDKDLGEILHDENWREHFLDDQSTINSTHWDEIHKEKWKTRTIFKCDKIEIFPREKDLNEFESIGGYPPRFYQKGFDIIVGENKKGDSMKLIGIVAKIAWSHNRWKEFDKEGYKKRGQYNYQFVEETGYAHEWWTFYEKFSEKYYYGHVELKGKKPRKEFKNGLIPIISYNINDKKIYLVGFYGNAEFKGSGFNTERKMIELFPDDCIDDLKLSIKETGDKWGVLEDILNGKRNYEGDIRAPKELSTVFDEEAYIPIDSKKDLNIKRLGQVVYSYIGDNETVSPANIYKLLLRAREKHKEILENVQNTQRREEIEEIIRKIDLALEKYSSKGGDVVDTVNYYLEISAPPWRGHTGKILWSPTGGTWKRIKEELKPKDVIIHYRTTGVKSKPYKNADSKKYPGSFVGYSVVKDYAKDLSKTELQQLLENLGVWNEDYRIFANSWISHHDNFWVVELEQFTEFEDDKKLGFRTIKDKFKFNIPQGKYIYPLNEKIAKEILRLEKFDIIREIQKTEMEKFTEKELLDHIITYIDSKGFTFSEDLIKNLYISLKTKPFVILSGISGIGKTALTKLFAEAIGARYTLISVKPDWNDDTDLFGYYNPLSKEYVKTEFLNFLLEASDNKNRIYVVCLDEMNLSHVEYYFAKFLSAMETKDKRINLHNIDNLKIEKNVYIPPNFFLIGTVNMDETTQSFSPKVLDRANSIEITFETDKIVEVSNSYDYERNISLSMNKFRSFKTTIDYEEEKRVREDLREIYSLIKCENLKFGFRTIKEVLGYIANAKGIFDSNKAFDVQIRQKILPKFSGSGVDLEHTLKNLKSFLKGSDETFTENEYKYQSSYQKIEEMKRRLERDGFTSFY